MKLIELGWRSDLLDDRLSGVLDHARWMAAIAVCLHHVRNLLLPDAIDAGPLSLPAKAFYFFTLFGREAVVVFFVASGVLVGGSVVRRLRSGTFNGPDFVIDRASRLYIVLVPAILLSLVLMLAGASMSCSGMDSPATVWGNLLFLQNIAVHPLCNNHPLWSLSNEAFYYAAFASGCCAIVSRKPAIIAGFSILVFIGALATIADPELDSIGFGALLWLAGMAPWFVKLRLPSILMLAAALLALAASRLHLLPNAFVGHLMIAATFALFLSARALPPMTGRIGAVLASKLAAFSYSLYLVHMPLAQAVRWGLGGQLDPTAASYAIYAVVVAAIILIAWIFGLVFEARTSDLRSLLRHWLKRSAVAA